MTSRASVVLPCYGGESYLQIAIDSFLAQSSDDSELVVVDDASPDRCGALADEAASGNPSVRIIHHDENQGVARAFNSGFSAANSKYLMRLAQDDVLKPSAVEKLTGHLDNNPEIAMVYADMEIIDSDGKVTGVFETGKPEEVLRTSARIGLCWMFRREVWDAGYRFDPAYDQVEDFEFWLRASQEFKVGKYEGPPLLQFRQHDAMGTRAHAARMEVLTADLLAERTDIPLLRTKIQVEGYLNASWIHRGNGNRGKALAWAVKAWVCKPFSARCAKNILGALLR